MLADCNSLDHCPPVVLDADLQLLKDPAALLQFRSVTIREGHVVNNEALLLINLQQRGNPVFVQLSSGAENKHFLHPLVLELICQQEEQPIRKIKCRFSGTLFPLSTGMTYLVIIKVNNLIRV